MSDKTRVFKARFTIADLRHQRNHQAVFTTALGKCESYEHFVLKLLGYCFFSYNNDAKLCQGDNKLTPDVAIQALDQHYLTWLSVDQPDFEKLQKVAKQVDDLWVLTECDSDWLIAHKHSLLRLQNSHLITVDHGFVSDLVAHLQRNLSWDITIDQHSISVADESHFYQSDQFICH
ncbi:YaeQ family protein [Pseudoalteromonas mariniglutinosa]|uniref:YaeQ family protein n=1 Tax=Pseudoalteromonas mariniglutinosa TaxID=206042 RepID=UPI00384B8EA4